MHLTPPQAATPSRVDPETVIDAFTAHYGRRPKVVVRTPGRVSLLGAHIDYSEGWVITGAIDRAVWLAAVPTSGSRVRIQALDVDETATLDLAQVPSPLPQRAGEKATWIDYPAGVAWALGEAGKSPRAMDVTFGGNLPIGAGVSSSAALEMAFLLAWRRFSPRTPAPWSPTAPIGHDWHARRKWLLGSPVGHHGPVFEPPWRRRSADLSRLPDSRFRAFTVARPPPACWWRIPASPTGWRIPAPGDRHYNDRRQQCSEAVEILKRRLPGIRTLRDVSVDDFALYRHLLPIDLRRRAQHAVEECRRGACRRHGAARG